MRIETIALIGDLERRSGHPTLALQPLEEADALAKMQWGTADRRTLHVEYLLAKEFDELGRVREATARLGQAINAFDQGGDRGLAEPSRSGRNREVREHGEFSGGQECVR